MLRLLPLLFLCACGREQLTVFTEYISFQTLPSYKINTPDPRLFCPDVGEKLHINWSLPKSAPYQCLYLEIELAFENGTFDHFTVPVETANGVYLFPLINEDYYEKGGVFSYRIRLYGDSCLIKEQRHILWKEPIDLSDQTTDLNP